MINSERCDDARGASKERDMIMNQLTELTSKGCGCLLVVDDSYHLIGTFTDGDLRMTLKASGQGIFKLTVGEMCDSFFQCNSNLNERVLPDNRENFICKLANHLMLEGDGASITVISWSDYDSNVSSYNYYPIRRYGLNVSQDSATLGVWAENVVLKDVGIKNNYGRGDYKGKVVAVTLATDKITVYGCSFIGIQDTVCDLYNRHYFNNCYIEGAIDFIWGFGQSLYESCNIQTVTGDQHFIGWITAHGRYKEDSSGFVFKDCTVDGAANAYLGRAW